MTTDAEGSSTAGSRTVTLDDVNAAKMFMKQDETGRWGYSATEVVDYLVAEKALRWRLDSLLAAHLAPPCPASPGQI